MNTYQTPDKIIEIKCPICDSYLISSIKNEDYGNVKIWTCNNCHRFWEEDWFNTFTQFEHCVTRLSGKPLKLIELKGGKE